MVPISTVIITKNEAGNIEDCIRSAKTVSDDVVVVDCGSEDETVALAKKSGAKVIAVVWQCYGHSRNAGAAAAKYDWILSLDADERVSPALVKALQSLSLENTNSIYKIKRENYFAGKQLHFGTLGFEKVARLYNRTTAQWDLFPVHEKLQSTASIKRINQPILHLGISTLLLHKQKKEWYALLSAQKYAQQQKKATFIKRFFAPAFDGVKSYVFQLGFLDGKKGWQVAVTISYYTWLKYHLLHQMTQEQDAQTATSTPVTSAFANALPSFFAKRG
jgi:glycosyltransferase involved in cell wall biosynthesis